MSALDFEEGVKGWLVQAFGQQVAQDMTERCDRFVEEALELVQSTGYDLGRVSSLVAYTDSRPKGEPFQEAGGVMVTLAALCYTARVPMMAAAVAELNRIRRPDIMLRIREKQAEKMADIRFVSERVTPAEKLSGDDRILWGVVANAGLGSRNRKPRWAHVSKATGLGSTYAAELCRRFGFDPEATVPAVMP